MPKCCGTRGKEEKRGLGETWWGWGKRAGRRLVQDCNTVKCVLMSESSDLQSWLCLSWRFSVNGCEKGKKQDSRSHRHRMECLNRPYTLWPPGGPIVQRRCWVSVEESNSSVSRLCFSFETSGGIWAESGWQKCPSGWRTVQSAAARPERPTLPIWVIIK